MSVTYPRTWRPAGQRQNYSEELDGLSQGAAAWGWSWHPSMWPRSSTVSMLDEHLAMVIKIRAQ